MTRAYAPRRSYHSARRMADAEAQRLRARRSHLMPQAVALDAGLRFTLGLVESALHELHTTRQTMAWPAVEARIFAWARCAGAIDAELDALSHFLEPTR